MEVALHSGIFRSLEVSLSKSETLVGVGISLFKMSALLIHFFFPMIPIGCHGNKWKKNIITFHTTNAPGEGAFLKLMKLCDLLGIKKHNSALKTQQLKHQTRNLFCTLKLLFFKNH